MLLIDKGDLAAAAPLICEALEGRKIPGLKFPPKHARLGAQHLVAEVPRIYRPYLEAVPVHQPVRTLLCPLAVLLSGRTHLAVLLAGGTHLYPLLPALLRRWAGARMKPKRKARAAGPRLARGWPAVGWRVCVWWGGGGGRTRAVRGDCVKNELCVWYGNTVKVLRQGWYIVNLALA